MGRSPVVRAADLFAGAGGASTGLLRACRELGLDVELLAINHWQVAVETHTINHPQVRHLCESVERVDPRAAVPGGRLQILLAGPECTHFSTARGGRPVNPQSRASAWHILKWAQELYIDSILIENVPEFRTWGPVGANGRPLKSRKGAVIAAIWAAAEQKPRMVCQACIHYAQTDEGLKRIGEVVKGGGIVHLVRDLELKGKGAQVP